LQFFYVMLQILPFTEKAPSVHRHSSLCKVNFTGHLLERIKTFILKVLSVRVYRPLVARHYGGHNAENPKL